MDRERAEKWCEWGILGLLLAMLVYSPLAMGAVRMAELVVLQWLTVGVLALWTLRVWCSREWRLLWPPVCWPVLAFVVYAIVRYRFADLEYIARIELIKVLIYAVIFFAVLNNFGRGKSSRIILFTVVFVATAVSVYAVYQFLTKSNFVWHFIRPIQYAGRGSGTYICPNHLAGFLEMVLPAALAFTLMGRVKPATRILLGYAALMILTGLGVSVSRGGWLAASVALLFFLLLVVRRREYRWWVAGFVLVTGITAYCFLESGPHARHRIEQIMGNGPSEDLRIELWQSTVKMWREHFWFGVGPAHFDQRFGQYRTTEVQLRPDRAHNDYLNTLADWGVVGGGIVAVFLVWWWIGAWRSWKETQPDRGEMSSRDSNRAALLVGAAAGMMAISVHSFTDFNMHVPANALVAMVLLALVVAQQRPASGRSGGQSGLAVKLAFLLVAMAVMTCLGRQAWSLAREDSLLRRASVSKSSAEHVLILKKALALEPGNAWTAYIIGEISRRQSWQLPNNYITLAREAKSWFEQASKINPFEPFFWICQGMCLDWIGDHREARRYYLEAERLDPNNFNILAYIGWHYVQAEDFATAKRYFERSTQMQLRGHDNPIAYQYLEIVNRRLKESKITN